MFKKLNKMKIGARLKKSFRQIILIFGILSALVVVIMLYTINNYGTILDNYAYPQGDIAMAMNESAEWSNGNTERIAKMLAEATGADLMQIDTEKPYEGSYNEAVVGKIS